MSLRIDISPRGATKAICGALKTTLTAHKVITPNEFGSAAKRIISQLRQKHQQENSNKKFKKFIIHLKWIIRNFPWSINKIIINKKDQYKSKKVKEYELYLRLKKKYDN